jgi:tRNA1(Val) A37 N6-methylase TrmN6
MLTREKIKHSGATFTPKGLADFLAKRISLRAPEGKLKILDPACGEGELLLAIGNCLTRHGADFHLTGYDANSHYLSIASERLAPLGRSRVELLEGDFLQITDAPSRSSLLSSSKAENNIFDIIIANPPYVRTQILGSEQAQELAKKFGLKGRVDLYYPFLIAMTNSLKEGGILGVITSNRFLFTKSGDSIRKYLSSQYAVLELIDLGDTKLFDAAVLPAIFIGRKGIPGNSSPTFAKIYEQLSGYDGPSSEVENIYDILESNSGGYFSVGGKKYRKTTGILRHLNDANALWKMLSREESEWVSAIDNNSCFRVADFFKVRVGIKTTADTVFIGDAWDHLGDEKPEDELLKDLISQENIKGWGAMTDTTLKVLYPHVSINGVRKNVDLDRYPRAKKYLLQHEAILRNRKYVIKAGREWFEIWVPHKPDLWRLPKLVFPDISATPRFTFDNEGKVVNGNCYWMVAQTPDDVEKLLLIQGIANSKLMTRYHDLVFNNKLYSGRRRYLTQYVEKYPLPDPNSSAAMKVIRIVQQLTAATDQATIQDLERDLEVTVAEAFNVAPVLGVD